MGLWSSIEKEKVVYFLADFGEGLGGKRIYEEMRMLVLGWWWV